MTPHKFTTETQNPTTLCNLHTQTHIHIYTHMYIRYVNVAMNIIGCCVQLHTEFYAFLMCVYIRIECGMIVFFICAFPGATTHCVECIQQKIAANESPILPSNRTNNRSSSSSQPASKLTMEMDVKTKYVMRVCSSSLSVGLGWMVGWLVGAVHAVRPLHGLANGIIIMPHFTILSYKCTTRTSQRTNVWYNKMCTVLYIIEPCTQ